MVIRATKTAERTPAQIRQAAQRKLARELKAGTFKPSPIGARSREIAKNYRAEKTALIKEIREYKNEVYGSSPKFNQARSDKAARTNPGNGKDWKVGELRSIAATLRTITENNERDQFYWAWDNIFEDAEYENALYYH